MVPSIHLDVHIKSSALSQDHQVIKETDQDPLVNATSTPRFFSEFFKTGSLLVLVLQFHDNWTTVTWVRDRAAQVKIPLLMLQVLMCFFLLKLIQNREEMTLL